MDITALKVSCYAHCAALLHPALALHPHIYTISTHATPDSPAWVKSQSRMSSTSNQETFRADTQGRLVFDVLRQVGHSSAHSSG